MRSFASAGAAAGELAPPLDPVAMLELDAFRGKVVVVDFWASWCVPCRRSFPWLGAMQRKYGDERRYGPVGGEKPLLPVVSEARFHHARPDEAGVEHGLRCADGAFRVTFMT